MIKKVAGRMQLRRGTAAEWTSDNPVLLEGEEGFETDTSKRKVGDGITLWNSLAYVGGGSGSGSGLERIENANENLGGHRAVYVNATGASYASADDFVTARACVGITTGAASSGADVTICTFGPLEEPSWSWTVDAPVFLGVNGALTQTVPVSGTLLQIGMAITATKLDVNVRSPISLI